MDEKNKSHFLLCKEGKHRWHLLKKISDSIVSGGTKSCIFICDRCGFLKKTEVIQEYVDNKSWGNGE